MLPERAYAYGVVLYWRWRLRSHSPYEKECELLPRFVSEDDLVVDIGANMGQYVAPMSDLVGPKGIVMAFEALPSTYELGKRIVSRSNVRWFNTAISDTEQKLSMTTVLDENGIINRGLTAVSTGDHESDVVVQASTLDSLLAKRTRKIAFIKCDVEGYEVAVIRGSLTVLSSDRPVLLIETSGKNLRELKNHFEPMRYDAFVCDDVGRLVRFDHPHHETNFNCFFIPFERQPIVLSE